MQSYLSDKERFADLFNGVFFQGEPVINPCELQDSSERYSEPKGQGINRFRDIKMSLKSGKTLRILAVENQTNIDYTMPFRCMQYDSMEYEKQLRELKNKNRNRKLLKKPAERLCGIAREDRLVPVYTLCLYHGEEPWDGPRSLRDMMDFGRDDDGISRYFSDYSLRLFCINSSDSFDMFHTELRELFYAMKFRRDCKKLLELFERNEKYRYLSPDTAEALSVFLNIPSLWKQRREYVSKSEEREVYNMCQAVQDWRKECIAKGKAEGIAMVVQNMLKSGFSDEQICKLTECTLEFIDQLR